MGRRPGKEPMEAGKVRFLLLLLVLLVLLGASVGGALERPAAVAIDRIAWEGLAASGWRWQPASRDSSPGRYLVTLTVAEAGAGSVKARLARQLKMLNAPPIADFSFTPAQPAVGEAVQFTDRSRDLDGYLVFWGWDFGDGTTCPPECDRVQAPVHSYSAPGTYTVTLTVIDERGGLDRTTKELTVAPWP